MAKSRRTIEYYTINSKVLPTTNDNTKRYSNLIENWIQKGYKIMHEGDKSHYFTLTTLDKLENNNDTIYYGVLSKFVKIDDLDFVDSETGKLVEYELPNNLQARSQQYEFMFIPSCHRFAFIKVGKIDSEIKKKGAPLKQIMNIIKLAFDQGLDKGTSTYVEIEQDSLVFDDIYSSKIISLAVRVSYTNDDSLRDESKKLMDEMLRSGKIAEMFTRMNPERNSEIDSSTSLPNGLIELARENGEVNALVEDDDGNRKRINTKEHPAVESISFEGENATKPNFLLETLRRFVERYIA